MRWDGDVHPRILERPQAVVSRRAHAGEPSTGPGGLDEQGRSVGGGQPRTPDATQLTSFERSSNRVPRESGPNGVVLMDHA